jgi:hypothetical protein
MFGVHRLVTPMIGIVYYRDAPYNGKMPGRNDLLLKGRRALACDY